MQRRSCPLQTVAVSDRHPDCAAPLYTKILQVRVCSPARHTSINSSYLDALHVCHRLSISTCLAAFRAVTPATRPPAPDPPPYQLLVLQVEYPSVYNPSVGWSSVPHDALFDSEDFLSFRDGNGVAVAVLANTFDLLQAGYFDALLAMLDETSWQRIEAVLFCIDCAVELVVGELADLGDGAPTPSLADAVQRVHGVMQWLLPRLVPAAMPEPLMTSSLRLFGTCAPVLRWVLRAGRGMASAYLGQIVGMLGAALCSPQEDVASGAAICIGQVCVECADELVHYVGVVTPLCDAFEVGRSAGVRCGS